MDTVVILWYNRRDWENFFCRGIGKIGEKIGENIGGIYRRDISRGKNNSDVARSDRSEWLRVQSYFGNIDHDDRPLISSSSTYRCTSRVICCSRYRWQSRTFRLLNCAVQRSRKITSIRIFVYRKSVDVARWILFFEKYYLFRRLRDEFWISSRGTGDK